MKYVVWKEYNVDKLVIRDYAMIPDSLSTISQLGIYINLHFDLESIERLNCLQFDLKAVPRFHR